MNRAQLIGLLAACCLIPLTGPDAQAVYSQPASTFSAGGGLSSSASYSNLAVIGQPGIVGSSSSASYAADHGFLPVLGGLKILYPVISATPGTFTFSLVVNTAGSQTLTVANAGGSNLEWTVTKGTPDSIFSASPVAGTIVGTNSTGITVTANATGLSVGSHYTNTLTVSGTGISDTVQVALALDVTAPGTYRLTVTPVSNTAGKGGGTITTDKGGISCQNSGSNPATATGTCQADIAPGTVVTLMQTPDANSTWATWTGDCSGSSANCQVTMNGNRVVTATFPYSSMAKVNSTGTGYESLALAYAGAAASDTILARDVTFSEAVVLNGSKAITLSGGLDAYYAPLNAWTIISGSLTVSQGSVNVNRLEIR